MGGSRYIDIRIPDLDISWSEKFSKVNLSPVTGRGGQQGCETSKIPHYLDIRLTDGGKIVSLTRWSRFTPQSDS
jgi:hypothetical protein